MTPLARQQSRQKRERQAELMRAIMQRPDQLARVKRQLEKVLSDPEFQARRRKRLIDRNVDPEFRKRVSARMKLRNAAPAVRAEIGERLKAAWTDERRSRQAEIARKRAIAINEARRRRRDVVPAGQMSFYKKLRRAGLDRKAALSQCWRNVQ